MYSKLALQPLSGIPGEAAGWLNVQPEEAKLPGQEVPGPSWQCWVPCGARV